MKKYGTWLLGGVDLRKEMGLMALRELEWKHKEYETLRRAALRTQRFCSIIKAIYVLPPSQDEPVSRVSLSWSNGEQ